MMDVSLSHGKVQRLLRGIGIASKKRRMVFVIGEDFKIAQARTDWSMNRKVARILHGIEDFAKITTLLTDNVRLSAQNLLDIRGEGDDRQRISMFEYMRLHTSTTEQERKGESLEQLMEQITRFVDGEEQEYVADLNAKLPGYC